MDFGKKTWWRGGDTAAKDRQFAAIESAEKIQADTMRDQMRNANVLRHKWVILRFYCKNCHTKHFWGGPQGKVGIINYRDFCPKIKRARDYKRIWLDHKFMDVPMQDALAYSPKK